jgi:MOSC domain-containing protein YiiM
MVTHRMLAELEAAIDQLRQAPVDTSAVALIVRRPGIEAREVIEEGELDVEQGLVGDTWKARGNARTPDGGAHPDAQITIMGARVAAVVAGEPSRWPLAGDQFFVDLDLSSANLPPGTRLAIGAAILEVSALPHTGCAKFVARFGLDAMKFVNSPAGRAMSLRGINARVIRRGRVRRGDIVRKLPRASRA